MLTAIPPVPIEEHEMTGRRATVQPLDEAVEHLHGRTEPTLAKRIELPDLKADNRPGNGLGLSDLLGRSGGLRPAFRRR